MLKFLGHPGELQYIGSSQNAHLCAVKTLQRIVDKIMQLFGAEKFDWKKWSREVCCPGDLDGQIDDWSCGLFLMMALQCFTLQIDYKKWCKDSLKEKMREKSLEALKAIPYVYSNYKDNKSMTNFNNSIKLRARAINLGTNSIMTTENPFNESVAEVASTYMTAAMKKSSSTAVNPSDNIIANQSNNNIIAASSARSISSCGY